MALSSENLDLNSLRIFLAVVSEGSFVLAGKKLGLTRSAVAKSIGRLEEYLGVRLFHRTTRTFSVTSDGQSYYERCVLAIQDLDDAEQALKNNHDHPTGTLRLTVPEAYGRIKILPVISQFCRIWPDVNIEVNFSDSKRDLIDEGLDLSIRLGTRPPTTDNLIIRVLGNYRSHLVASPDYLAASGTPTNTEELKLHNLLTYGSIQRYRPWSVVLPDGSDYQISGQRRLFFDSIEAIRDAAIEGGGLALLPEFMTCSPEGKGQLVNVLDEIKSEILPAYIIYPTRKHLSAKVRYFIDMLVKSEEVFCSPR